MSMMQASEQLDHTKPAIPRKPNEAANFTRASDFKNVGERVVVGLPVALEQRHPYHAVRVGDVGDHLAIARLENMQRHAQTRKQHKVGQRKDWNDSG